MWRKVLFVLLLTASLTVAAQKKGKEPEHPVINANAIMHIGNVDMFAPSAKEAVSPKTVKAALNEGFESSFPPPGWLMITNGISGNNGWQQASNYRHSGSYSAYHNDDNVTGLCSSWLITPPLVVTAGNDTLKYWQYNYFYAYYYYHGIWIDTTASGDTTNFFELKELGAGTTSWEQLAETLSAYIGDTIQVAFKYQGDYADEWYIDDVIGPEAVITDTFGPGISTVVFPQSHFQRSAPDTVVSVVTDLSGVAACSLFYALNTGSGWGAYTGVGMVNTVGDTFVGTIPAQAKGTQIGWYVYAVDGIGNSSTDPVGAPANAYVYSILPTGPDIIVYESTSYGLADRDSLINSLLSLGITPFDMVEKDDLPSFADSLPLWTEMWLILSYNLDTTGYRIVGDFLHSGSGVDRKKLFVSGDDIAYSSYSGGRAFIEKYLKGIYIRDDLSSPSDSDTIVGIPGDPISDGMPDLHPYSSYPDMVFSKARALGDSIDTSDPFCYVTNGDSTETPGGLAYSGLEYVAAYVPYEMRDFNSADRDTLIKRIYNAGQVAPMPPIPDWCNIQWPYSLAGIRGGYTDYVYGQVWEDGVTNVPGNEGRFTVQVGFGPDGSYPYESDQWIWSDMTFNMQSGNNYEYMGGIFIPDTTPLGTYDYCVRYSFDHGPWIYADINGTDSKTYNYNYDPANTGNLFVGPGESDVVLNEIYYDEPGTDTTSFTELFGLPDLSLDSLYLIGVNGNNGDWYDTIPLSGYTIPSDSFFVVGQTATIPNVDLVDPKADWQNGADNVLLVLMANGNTIIVDAVGYGTDDTTSWVFVGEGLPVSDPGPVPIYRFPDGADTDNNSFDFYGWIPTPGIPNYPPIWTTIAAVQDTTGGAGADTSAFFDSCVVVTGVVSGGREVFGSMYYIQSGSGPWNGVYLYDNQHTVSTGDSIEIAGIVTEYNGLTEIHDVTHIARYGTGTVPAAYLTTPGAIDTSESLEGVLVELDHVIVSDSMDTNGEWKVMNEAMTETCIVDDDASYSFVTIPGTKLASLTGIVKYSYGNYKIEPRGDADIVVAYDLTGTVGLSDNPPDSSGSRVDIIGTSLFDSTDVHGAYGLYWVPADSYQVVATHNGYFPETLTVDLTSSSQVVDFLLTKMTTDVAMDSILSPSGSIAAFDNITPSCRLVNLGNVLNDSFFVFVEVDTNAYVVHKDSVMIHPADFVSDTAVATFASWIIGDYGTVQPNWTFYHTLIDDNPANDTLSHIFPYSGIGEKIPKVFSVSMASNPAYGRVRINLALPTDENVRIYIYDRMGRMVKTLANKRFKAGYYKLDWNGRTNKGILPAGVYFYRLDAGKYRKTDKFIFMK